MARVTLLTKIKRQCRVHFEIKLRGPCAPHWNMQCSSKKVEIVVLTKMQVGKQTAFNFLLEWSYSQAGKRGLQRNFTAILNKFLKHFKKITVIY